LVLQFGETLQDLARLRGHVGLTALVDDWQQGLPIVAERGRLNVDALEEADSTHDSDSDASSEILSSQDD
jgi:hypothetical protein